MTAAKETRVLDGRDMADAAFGTGARCGAREARGQEDHVRVLGGEGELCLTGGD